MPETTASLLPCSGSTHAPSRRSRRARPEHDAHLPAHRAAPGRHYAFKVAATRRRARDGELRPLPVLPSRMHLVAVALRHAAGQRQPHHDVRRSGKNDDPTRGQRAAGGHPGCAALLHRAQGPALPCRAIPTSAPSRRSTASSRPASSSSLFRQYPAVAKMAKEFSQRNDAAGERFDPDAIPTAR